MGRRNSATRRALEKITDEEFADFLDDVAEHGLKYACAGEHDCRDWTQSATVNWIRASEARSNLYGIALEVRAELAIHEGREIVDGATPDDVSVAKLRGNWRQWEAAKWNRARYGETVKVDHGGTIKFDAGLTVAIGDLLERAATGRVLEHEAPTLTYQPQRAEESPAACSREAEPVPPAAGDGERELQIV